MSSLSPSDPIVLDLDGPMRGTWGLVAGVVGIHVVSALWLTHAGHAGAVDALLLPRTTEMRVAVGGQLASAIAAGERWRLATSVLLHADALHLVLNATALWALGRILEPRLGSLRLWSWFCAGGVGGSLVSHLAGMRQSDGASGGAFALLGATVILGWRWRDRLDEEDRWLLGPVLWGFLAINLLVSFAIPVVDAAGHLGGLAVGLLVAFLPEGAWSWLDVVVVSVFVGCCAYGWTCG